MAIKSSAFGSVVLTGEDASAFSRQIKYGHTNAAAKATIRRADEMNAAFRSGGGILKVEAIPHKKDVEAVRSVTGDASAN